MSARQWTAERLRDVGRDVAGKLAFAWLLTLLLFAFVNRACGGNPFNQLAGFGALSQSSALGVTRQIATTTFFNGVAGSFIVMMPKAQPYELSIGRSPCGLYFTTEPTNSIDAAIRACSTDTIGGNVYPLARIKYPPWWAANTADITLFAHVESLQRVFGESLDDWMDKYNLTMEAADREAVATRFKAFLDDGNQLNLQHKLNALKQAMFFNGHIQFATAWVFFYGLLSLALAIKESAGHLREEAPVLQFVVGVIPMVGFYGTIVGIAASLEAVGLTKSVNPIVATVSDAAITSGIGVAFETTKFGIVLCVVLGWLVALGDRAVTKQ